MTRSVAQVLHETPTNSLFWTYIFGALWGLGGLTFGLTMRYLGMSLGMAVALGYTAVFGTLRSEEHTSELQSRLHIVCRLLLEKKKYIQRSIIRSFSNSQDVHAHNTLYAYRSAFCTLYKKYLTRSSAVPAEAQLSITHLLLVRR